MTKEQLKALGLDDKQIEEVFKLNGKAITKEQQRVESLDQELVNANNMLKDANAKIEQFQDLDIDTIKQEAKNYKEQLEATKLENEKKINELKYEATLKEYMQGHTFASERIKNSIFNDIKQKEFKLEDGKLLGADDYIKVLKETEPESFAKVESEETPNFLRPTGKNIPKSETKVMSIADMAREANIRK